MNPEYYQKLHETNEAYKNNNWLLSHINDIMKFDCDSLTEIGCGNGKFLVEAQKHFKTVKGIDFAKSLLLPEDVEFLQADLKTYEFDNEELICSSDVLEHLEIDDLHRLIKNMTDNSQYQYHVIACYDDGHSHLTVMRPEQWYELFSQYGEFQAYNDLNTKGKEIVIISTIRE